MARSRRVQDEDERLTYTRERLIDCLLYLYPTTDGLPLTTDELLVIVVTRTQVRECSPPFPPA